MNLYPFCLLSIFWGSKAELKLSIYKSLTSHKPDQMTSQLFSDKSQANVRVFRSRFCLVNYENKLLEYLHPQRVSQSERVPARGDGLGGWKNTFVDNVRDTTS